MSRIALVFGFCLASFSASAGIAANPPSVPYETSLKDTDVRAAGVVVVARDDSRLAVIDRPGLVPVSTSVGSFGGRGLSSGVFAGKPGDDRMVDGIIRSNFGWPKSYPKFGVVVYDTDPKAGLLGAAIDKGDVIFNVNGKATGTAAQFTEAAKAPGRLLVKYQRFSKEKGWQMMSFDSVVAEKAERKKP